MRENKKKRKMFELRILRERLENAMKNRKKTEDTMMD